MSDTHTHSDCVRKEGRGSEDKLGAGARLEAAVGLEEGGGPGPSLTVVQGDDVQAVEQLPLVLVDPLHVHIKHGGGVDLHLILLLQEGGELQLVFLGRRDGKMAAQFIRTTLGVLQGPNSTLAFRSAQRTSLPIS